MDWGRGNLSGLIHRDLDKYPNIKSCGVQKHIVALWAGGLGFMHITPIQLLIGRALITT